MRGLGKIWLKIAAARSQPVSQQDNFWQTLMAMREGSHLLCSRGPCVGNEDKCMYDYIRHVGLE